MGTTDSSVYLFNTHSEADDAIRLLDRAGFDMKKLSLIGKGYHSDEHPIGFYTTGDRIKTWEGQQRQTSHEGAARQALALNEAHQPPALTALPAKIWQGPYCCPGVP